jgi:hypothetical protein
MRKLVDDLRLIMKHTIYSSEFIDKAQIPVIKLKIDLFKVHSQAQKHE